MNAKVIILTQQEHTLLSVVATVTNSNQNRTAEYKMNLQLWSLAAIVDDLIISMLETKTVFCMINRSDVRSNGLPRSIYEEQARYKMYRIPVFRPPPVFVIYLKHFDEKLKKQLANLDRESKDCVIREAIGRLFEQVDKKFFLLSVKPLLRWKLEN